MTNRNVVSQKAFLAEYSKDIVNHRPLTQHQGVDEKLCRGQPLQIQIRLDFTVKRLAQPPVFVKSDDAFFRKVHVRSLSFEFDIRFEKHLAFGVGRLHRDSNHQPKTALPALVVLGYPYTLPANVQSNRPCGALCQRSGWPQLGIKGFPTPKAFLAKQRWHLLRQSGRPT